MNKNNLIDKLDKATNRAVALAIDNKMPLPITKNTSVVGNLLVEKNKNGLYNVLTMSRRPVFEDIMVYDVAVILAQRYVGRDNATMTRILDLEKRYAKHHTDMVYYLYNLKSSLKRHDYERALILEDKFKVAEAHAKQLKDQLILFKKIK